VVVNTYSSGVASPTVDVNEERSNITVCWIMRHSRNLCISCAWVCKQ